MKKHLLYLLLVIGIVSSTYGQTIWYVNQSASGTQSGTSWNDAFHNIQIAINSAASGDTIWVASGTYYPTEIAGGGTNQRDMTFLLKSGVSIIGGFKGTESNSSERITDASILFGANKTVLSGDIGIKNVNSDNVYHVLTVLDNTSASKIDGFEIRAGNANDSSNHLVNGIAVARNFGGGLYVRNSIIDVQYCRLQNNDAISGGGGMFSDNSQYTITHSRVDSNNVFGNNPSYSGGGGILNIFSAGSIRLTDFRDNEITDAQGGGAMRNENSIFTIEKVEFLKNIVNNGDGGAGMYNTSGSNQICKDVKFSNNYTNKQGAGMYNDNSKPILENCEFDRNTSDNGGGAMENDGGSDAILRNVVFTNNDGGVDGGAIQNWKSSPRIENCKFLFNSAGQDGGAIFNYTDCSPFVFNSHFDSNVAGRNGGAIYNRRNSNPILTNLLIVNNKAGSFGGGFWTGESNGSPCSPIATNITAVNNHADSSGGGGFDDGAGNSKLRNSIIHGNTSLDVDEIDAPSSLSATALFKTIIGNDFYVNGVTTPSPVTGLIFVDTAAENYTLRAGSAAIDLGDSSYFNSGQTPDLSTINLDQNGADRIQGSEIDLGALEFCIDIVEPTIEISIAPDSMINEGALVTLNATYTGGGALPHFIWNRNQVAIPGPDTSEYSFIALPDMNGDEFSVTLESSNGCASSPSVNSNSIHLDVITGINDMGDFSTFYVVAPNPNNGEFKIIGKNFTNESIRIEIVDLKGQVIQSNQLEFLHNEVQIKLNESIKTGFYILRITTLKESYSTRILINQYE